jgi:hypothetical protein
MRRLPHGLIRKLLTASTRQFKRADRWTLIYIFLHLRGCLIYPFNSLVSNTYCSDLLFPYRHPIMGLGKREVRMPRGVYKKSPEHIAKLQKGLEAGRSPKARAKAAVTLKKIAANPEWRAKVSQAVKVAMHRPEVRERHLAKLPKKGQSNFRGGNGQEPTELQKFAAAILEPLGFKREYPIKTNGHGTNHNNVALAYKADFAHPENMIVIELDIPAHNLTKQMPLDLKRDEVLTALGWQVIRVKHK